MLADIVRRMKGQPVVSETSPEITGDLPARKSLESGLLEDMTVCLTPPSSMEVSVDRD